MVWGVQSRGVEEEGFAWLVRNGRRRTATDRFLPAGFAGDNTVYAPHGPTVMEKYNDVAVFGERASAGCGGKGQRVQLWTEGV